MEKQHHDILARYSAILELHEHMLEIAMAGDWEQLQAKSGSSRK